MNLTWPLTLKLYHFLFLFIISRVSENFFHVLTECRRLVGFFLFGVSFTAPIFICGVGLKKNKKNKKQKKTLCHLLNFLIGKAKIWSTWPSGTDHRVCFFSFHYFFRFLLKYQAAIFDQFFPSKKCFRFLSSNFVFILGFIWVGSSIFCLFVCETDEAKSSRRFHWGQSGQIPQEENVWRWSQEQGGLWNWDPPPWKQFFPAPCSEKKNPKKNSLSTHSCVILVIFFFLYTIVLFNFCSPNMTLSL